MGQLSSAPEGHLSRTSGSPVAERRGNQEFAAQLPRSPSAERRENARITGPLATASFGFKATLLPAGRRGCGG